MIYGVGTDISAVARLQSMWERHGDKAIERLLAPSELAEFALAADKGRFLAKRFAAKEAFVKALGTGLRAPAVLPAISVGHDDRGKPNLAFHGRLAELVQNRRLTAHVSISDEVAYAVAFVILEQA
jgi:holo-[acyl-carrier protein] synthase